MFLLIIVKESGIKAKGESLYRSRVTPKYTECVKEEDSMAVVPVGQGCKCIQSNKDNVKLSK